MMVSNMYAPDTSILTANNVTRGFALAGHVERADNFWLRLRGLLGRDVLPAGEGLLITHCSSVHTFGMAFAIDVLHLDRDGRVHTILPAMKPWRAGPWVPRAATVLELPAGASRDTQVGDIVEFQARNELNHRQRLARRSESSPRAH